MKGAAMSTSCMHGRQGIDSLQETSTFCVGELVVGSSFFTLVIFAFNVLVGPPKLLYRVRSEAAVSI